MIKKVLQIISQIKVYREKQETDQTDLYVLLSIEDCGRDQTFVDKGKLEITLICTSADLYLSFSL